MSYAGLSGIEPWNRIAAEADEAYILRSTFDAPIRSIEDMQDIARAAGFATNWPFNLRGIAVAPLGGGRFSVDAVYTTPVPFVVALFPFPLPLLFDSASSAAQKIQTALLRRFPNLRVSGAQLLQITDDDPKHPALTFWRTQPIVWDRVSDYPGAGLPTSAFGNFKGLFRGKADEGINLKAWPKEDPGKLGPKKDDVDTTVFWAIGGAAVFWFIWSRGQKRGAA